MQIRRYAAAAALVCALFGGASHVVYSEALAEGDKEPLKVHSKEFDRLKKLEGAWHGEAMMHGKPGEMDITYHLTSGGSAIVETISPGTPHEMVSVYHDDHGKLTMTHYCMIGNQPKLDLVSATPNSMDFEFGKGNSIHPKTELHMHSLRVSFIDDDNIVQHWTSFRDGKPGDEANFKLARVK